MAKIKKISFADTLNIKKLISVVCSDNIINYRRLFLLSVPTTFFQNLFYSVHFRKFTETYVAYDTKNDIKGLLSVKAQKGNPFKWQIKRLFLAKDSFEHGKQLIEYFIAKFGARGVDTFYVNIIDNNNELIDLFVNGCGFRSCSTEALWRVSNLNFLNSDFNEEDFKKFKNSDAKQVADFFNDNLNSLYKYSLSKEKEEFNDGFFQGINSNSYFKYIYTDEKQNILSYIEIKTFDNKNYFLDIIIAPHVFDAYNSVISFAVKQIMKRNKNFNLYIKNRKYLQSGELLEGFFRDNRFEQLQSNAILVRDFFKSIKESSPDFHNAVVFSGFEV